MKESYEKQRLLVKVAKLYYEEGMDQEDIAQKLYLSRPYISKLLKEARKSGLVQFKVIDPFEVRSPLEEEFRSRFGLEHAIIVPDSTPDNPYKNISNAGAAYLDKILQEEDIIATSWGETLFHFSNALLPRYDIRKLTYVSLCGGWSNVQACGHAAEIAKNFSSAYNCASYQMTLPAIVSSIQLKKLMEEDAQLSKVFQLGKRATIAIMTVGAFGPNSALLREGYLSSESILTLQAENAVGDICSHVINTQGEICSQELDARTFAVSFDDLKKMRIRIGIAQGNEKVSAIHAALCSGVMNVFITDESTAKQVLSI